MSPTKAHLQSQTWHKDSFVISTSPQHFPIHKLISVFESEEIYWAKTLPADAMQDMIDNSLSFGLYEQISPNSLVDSNFIGIARCVTDFTTFAYLTDVWVDAAYRGKGLGSWLVRCVDETLEGMPHLRKTLLATDDWDRTVPFYQETMKMDVLKSKDGEGLAFMAKRGRGHIKYEGARAD